MLPFMSRSLGSKRARSHRNTVSSATGKHGDLSGCNCVERHVRFLGGPEAME
jgi:hypothetical protein